MMRISKGSAWLACGGLLLAATAALAGSGVGGVFNLGQVNTVNGRTQLQGFSATQSLRVVNSSEAMASAAISGQANRGTGVLGSSTSRMGVRALATNTSGVNYGIYATTASARGLAGYFENTNDPTGNGGIALVAASNGSPVIPNRYGDPAGAFIGYNGVLGVSAPGSGNGFGVIGHTSEPSGAGVHAAARSSTGTAYGLWATSSSADGLAGFFQNSSSTTDELKGAGLRALAAGASADAIPSYVVAGGGEFVGPNGVIGVATRQGGYGVLAVQGAGSHALLTQGSVYVSNDLIVIGNVEKGSGTFKIDHPLDPANRYLSHSFVESPDMMNIYNGIVTTGADATAVVELPGYFEALNRDPRYQLTVIGSFADAQISREVSGNSFAIQTEEPNVKVSWQITGIRRDAFAEAHPVVVEEDKVLAERGRYLHPEEHGQPAELAIAPQGLRQQAAQGEPESGAGDFARLD